MNNKSIHLLEFDKIRHMLSECAATDGAKQKALSIVPLSDMEKIISKQNNTTDAKALSMIKGSPSFFDVKDIKSATERARKGAMLSIKDLIACSAVFKCARTLKEYAGTEGMQTSLAHIFERLTANRFFEEKFDRCILSEEMIADEASPELADIRRKMRQITVRIRDILQKYISSGRKFLQEGIVTTRGGRYVIPVKSEYRSEVKGLIHDTSQSGSTLFIEPMSVVEANNEFRALEGKESREIERILYELSADVQQHADTIDLNYYNITELAYIFACAELSVKMNAAMPHIVNERKFDLRRARHPLLEKNKVVPVSLSMNKSDRMLIITGPNTGGKTVTLKTIGLFAMMAQSGLHIPADDDSTVCVFDDILADIGDEQSIEHSLSTFSSHMKSIISFIEDMSENSLILFDELGAGTDPVEGAALAASILEQVRITGALCAATTHYAELKSYAIGMEGVVNASCEFDVETLKPTYKLIIGAPGKSNAFAISQKLGLPEKIVTRARDMVENGARNFENVIEKLETARVELEKEKEEAALLKTEFEDFKKKSEKEILRRVSLSEKEAKANLERSRRLLDEARATSNYVFEELDKVRKEKESQNLSEKLAAAKRNVRQRVRDYDNALNPADEHYDDENYVLPRPLKKGDMVVHRNIGTKGTLVCDPDKNGNTVILMGAVKTRANVKDLRLLENESNEKKKKDSMASYKASVSKSFKPECDVRGMTGEEGWFVVDKYLDEAKVASVKSVTIIHGKGTGALRSALWRNFKSDNRIKNFRAGQYGEGDYGVTVVELK